MLRSAVIAILMRSFIASPVPLDDPPPPLILQRCKYIYFIVGHLAPGDPLSIPESDSLLHHTEDNGRISWSPSDRRKIIKTPGVTVSSQSRVCELDDVVQNNLAAHAFLRENTSKQGWIRLLKGGIHAHSDVSHELLSTFGAILLGFGRDRE